MGGMLHLIHKYKRDDSVSGEVQRNTVFFGYDVALTGAHAHTRLVKNTTLTLRPYHLDLRAIRCFVVSDTRMPQKLVQQ